MITKPWSAFAPAILLVCVSLCASADVLKPVSYDMRNGDSGSLKYWDGNYTGAGDTKVDASPLSGGLGALTDGVVATESWNLVENAQGTGPYVGWLYANGVPEITFRFAGVETFESMTLYVDDSDGTGDVYPPRSATVTIGAWTSQFQIGNLPGREPKAVPLMLGGAQGDVVRLRMDYFGPWIFMSEASFSRSPVPEPGTWALLGAGLAGLGWRGRRARARA